MTLEKQLYDKMVADLAEDEKRLKELKAQMAAKEIVAKKMEKEIKRKPFGATKFGRFYLGTLRVLTNAASRVNGDATHALEMPRDFEACELIEDAEKFYSKCVQIKKEHKKALKYCERAASMVMQLESMAEKDGLCEGRDKELIDLADILDQEVQRLRPEKEKEECSAQQSPSQSSPQSDASSSTESSPVESESSSNDTPSSQTSSASLASTSSSEVH